LPARRHLGSVPESLALVARVLTHASQPGEDALAAALAAEARDLLRLPVAAIVGADAVISSSAAAGRLLGMALDTPEVASVLEDLLSIGEGLDIEQHVVSPGDEGPAEGRPGWGPIVAVVRAGDLLHFNEQLAQDLRAGDRVIALRSHGREPAL
jgi:voltage-gated potassium channel